MSAATFDAVSSFSLPSRRWFVISGNVVSGLVKRGMVMKVSMNSALSLSLPIDAVEIATKEGRSEVALCTVYQDDEERLLLESLGVSGERILIDDPATSDAQKG